MEFRAQNDLNWASALVEERKWSILNAVVASYCVQQRSWAEESKLARCCCGKSFHSQNV